MRDARVPITLTEPQQDHVFGNLRHITRQVTAMQAMPSLPSEAVAALIEIDKAADAIYHVLNGRDSGALQTKRS